MAKLHEVLAADNNLKGQAVKARGDLMETFEKKRHLFGAKLITFIPSAEGGEQQTREESDIQTSVTKEVHWLSGILIKAMDTAYAVDIANTQAKADIVLEDSEDVLMKDVPATALLQLEKRIREVQEFVRKIPTLDPARGFKQATDREPGIYAAREVNKDSTKKEQEYVTVAAPTKEHPAQVVGVVKDIKVGTIREQEWSSLITPAMKAELMDRTDILLRAVSRARSRANEQEVDTKSNKIGKKLLEFVFQPLNA